MVNPRFLGLGIAPEQIADSTIEFGEWLPDMPELENPGAVEALNVIPGEGGYVPFADLIAGALRVPTVVRGALALRDSDDSTAVYVATENGIFIRQPNGEFSQAYTTTQPLFFEDVWQFVPYGSSIVALHPQVRPVVSDVGGLPVFSPLGGNPPIARCGSRVGDFLVLGNLDGEPDDNGRKPYRIRWSGYNNIEAPWTTDPATQADFNDMPAEGGEVVAITGRETGTIFQAKSISRMQYVGLPTVFDISTVEEARGAISTNSVIDLGTLVFFIAEDGFHVWNGTNTTPIGDNKVNRYFFNKLNYGLRSNIVGVVDYVNSCVMWAFPTGLGTALTEIIIYSYKENKWSHADCMVEWLVDTAKFDASLDDLGGNMDTDYVESFDSGIYRGGRRFLGGFDMNHAYGLFNGSARAATLDTGEYSAPGGRRVFTNSARPMVDVAAAVATLQTLTRDQLIGEPLAYGAVTAQELTGECPIMVDARYARFRMGVPAGTVWRHARGVQIWRKATGRR